MKTAAAPIAAVNQDRVDLLMLGAAFFYATDLAHLRDSYAITQVSKLLIGVTLQEKLAAVESLRKLRAVDIDPAKAIVESRKAV